MTKKDPGTSGRRPGSRKRYKAEIRRNRQRHVKQALGNQLEQAGVAGKAVGDAFLRDLVSLQNRTRGALFEVLGEALLESHLRGLGLEPGSASRHVCVMTPWGRRFTDLWFDAHKTVVEVKSGYVCAGRSVRCQVQKDEWLLTSHRDVDEVVWLLFRGASASLLKRLTKAGIQVVYVDWDVEQ